MSKVHVGIIFVFILALGIILYYFQTNKKQPEETVKAYYKPWETESVLLQLDTTTDYDILFMGSSHGRLYSRNKNHEISEYIFNKEIATVASGSSCVIPEKVYLSTFFDMNNTAKTVFYFIDPWCFYTAKYNEGYPYNQEPFNQILLKNMELEKIPKNIMLAYKNTSIRNEPPSSIPPIEPRTDALTEIDSSVIQARILDLYSGKIPEKMNTRYQQTMEEIIDLSLDHNVQFIFVLPPTLYTDPHYKSMLGLLESYTQTYDIEVIDMSESMKDISLYYDHDHLNSTGVPIFLKKLRTELAERNIIL